MRRGFPIAILMATLLWAAGPLAADVKLPALICDNMVIQQGVKTSVWGLAGAGEKVTVSVNKQSASATADAAGKWRVSLPAMKAGGPFEMTISGANTIKLANVMVGEVWLCAGQSNMAMAMGSRTPRREEIASGKFAGIRVFTVARTDAVKPRDDVRGRWLVCNDRKTIATFSAVGWMFGREIHKARKVPVGLIQCSVGGTGIASWMSERVLAADPSFKADLARKAKEVARSDRLRADYQTKLAAWRQAVAAAKANGTKPPRKPQPSRYVGKYATGFYNGMVHPLRRYAVGGAIWYHGGGNAYSYGTAAHYEKLLPAMIKDWRGAWGRNFHLIIVQQPNYHDRLDDPSGGTNVQTGWARLREAQLKTLAVANTSLAVTIDLGMARNIHPPNKTDVALRTALVARAKVYGEKLVYSGPRFASMKIAGAQARLSFTHVGGGLVAKGGGKLAGFAIAGADKQWHWADAVIDGEAIVVSAAKVAAPVAVRYAWADNPDCNLYNAAGLPASPFRTDNWTPRRK